MTDKVIIDGIDMNKCMYLEDGMCKATRDVFGDYTSACTDYDIQDCYYRQLKLKEQECEQLKKQRESDKGLIKSLGKDVYALHQECEELKPENFTFEELIKTQEEFITKLETKIAFYKKYEKERSKTHKDAIHDLVLLKRYKQALDEIEKLCKNDINFKYNDKKFTISKILAIINEAKEK